jgi:hypothetical protein
MERFSHSSLRTDPYIGRVADMAAGAIVRESSGGPGMTFDGVFI